MKIKFIGILLLFSCNTIKGEKFKDICYDEGKNRFKNVEIADVENLGGEIVQVEGIFHLNFEDVAIYIDNSSAPSRALWLNFSDSVNKHKELYNFDGKRVIVTGIVNTRDKGHMSEYLGALDSVFCIRIK